MFLISWTVLSLACAVICHYVAKRRGGRPVRWGMAGLVFGPLSLPFLLFAGK